MRAHFRVRWIVIFGVFIFDLLAHTKSGVNTRRPFRTESTPFSRGESKYWTRFFHAGMGHFEATCAQIFAPNSNGSAAKYCRYKTHVSRRSAQIYTWSKYDRIGLTILLVDEIGRSPVCVCVDSVKIIYNSKSDEQILVIWIMCFWMI